MRSLLFILTLPLLAQDASQTPVAQTQESPVPPGEDWLTGSIDLGYRFRTGVDGSMLTYLSIVDLHSGFTLLGADFTIRDPKHRLFDAIKVRASDWGAEPYESLHVDISKTKLYDFNADYRDIAYFNYLPSYADPLLSRNLMLDEQAYDERRHFTNFSLDLLPGNWVTPYVAFSRDADSGFGTTVFVTDVNEFPTPDTFSDHTNNYRGGLRFQFRRFHATVEEGATEYREDQEVYQLPGSTNFGNNLIPSFGQTIDLSRLLASYGITGSSYYSRGLFTANVTDRLDFYGQFMYSEPSSKVAYDQIATGNLELESQILFYSGQQFLLTAASKLPHTTASAGAEIRPMKRVRIIESWLTDRLHNAGSASSTNLLFATPSEQIAGALATSLATNYNQNQIDLFYEAHRKLTLRAGYRYVWGNANDAIVPAIDLVSADSGSLHRNVALGGFTLRPIQPISITGEAEVASSTGAYFRTSLYNYQKVRGQIRYQATKSLSFANDFLMLDNQNPVPGVNYNYSLRQESLSLFFAPASNKYFDLEGSYTRSGITSNIGIFDPANLQPLASNYVDDAHIATGLVNVKLPHSGTVVPKLSLGGSLFISSGSRPTSYYQPVATLWLPMGKHVAWFADWRYYGYGEAFYLYEGFHTHILTTGLRFSR
jgi:hypothetical protein